MTDFDAPQKQPWTIGDVLIALALVMAGIGVCALLGIGTALMVSTGFGSHAP